MQTNTTPATKDALRQFVAENLMLSVPDKSICTNHDSPMDYLWYAFNENTSQSNLDCIVWANRGGGKTQTAAAAAMLDCIFKSDCKVRILGGSLEQSSKMYEYIKAFVYSNYEELIEGKITKRSCKFTNGANAEILTQSQKSVRGSHIQKLRCDEVELFDKDVLSAANFITKSSDNAKAAMEILSTMHNPYGLMHKAVGDAGENGVRIFKWCMFETIEQCKDRNCSQCPLWNDCGGKAKNANGYLRIDDCISMMRRSSRASWESEMLCKRPSRDNAVFADFDEAVHIGHIDYDPSLPIYRAMDFGFVNPFVCLFIQVDNENRVRVFDEYVKRRASAAANAEMVKKLTPCDEEKVAATYCDPAGAGTSDTSGSSAVKELANVGIKVKYRKSSIIQGLELIRAALRDAQGSSKLIISPRCVRLVEAMAGYHYTDRPQTAANPELPLKDGTNDHYIDSLRYFFVNYQKPSVLVSRKY